MLSVDRQHRLPKRGIASRGCRKIVRNTNLEPGFHNVCLIFTYRFRRWRLRNAHFKCSLLPLRKTTPAPRLSAPRRSSARSGTSAPHYVLRLNLTPMSLRFSSKGSSSVMPARLAARIFSFTPPTGITAPQRRLARHGDPLLHLPARIRSRTIDVTIVMPAEGRPSGIAPSGTWMLMSFVSEQTSDRYPTPYSGP